MNKNKTLYAAMYLLGLISGCLIAYDRTKHRYEQILQDEIAQVKAHYAQYKEAVLEETEDTPEDTAATPLKETDEAELKRQLHQLQYNNPPPEQDKEHPYVITPDEFGELEDYETTTLTYYSDGVLTDDMDQVVENIADTVGNDAVTCFGQYEDDAVYIRNDQRKMDYEILRDYRQYADVLAAKPYLMGD